MIEVKDLHFSAGETPILNGVTFSIKSGERVGIIGPNGSGKTTLFNCLSGFNPVSKGSIVYNGKPITTLRPDQRARAGLGRVFQNFGVFRDMTLSENIVTALESKTEGRRSVFRRSKKAGRQDIAGYLEMVGLEERAAAKASSLSGGQMRMLEIVRTVAFGAELLLLDEPTAGVSPKMKLEIAALLRKLQTLGKTFVIIEHDINFIHSLCNRIIVLDQGRIVLDDSPERVRNNPLLQEIYFGTPVSADNGSSGLNGGNGSGKISSGISDPADAAVAANS